MKICNVCKKEKELKEFRARCLKCKKCERDILRTPLGLAKKIWHAQVSSSKRRGHNAPEYTKSEFIAWFLNHEKFHKLYNDWEKSGYERLLSPSPDRLNDFKGYSFENLQLITFTENCKKPQQLHFKKVIQYDLNMNKIAEFESAKDAAITINGDSSRVSKVCRMKRNSAGGFIWRYK